MSLAIPRLKVPIGAMALVLMLSLPVRADKSRTPQQIYANCGGQLEAVTHGACVDVMRRMAPYPDGEVRNDLASEMISMPSSRSAPSPGCEALRRAQEVRGSAASRCCRTSTGAGWFCTSRADTANLPPRPGKKSAGA